MGDLDSPVIAAAKLSLSTNNRSQRGTHMHPATLSGVVAEHIDAVNAMDIDRIVDTCDAAAYVNDNRRDFAGLDAIRRWVEREMVGDKVAIDVVEVLDHHGDTIVRGRYDGVYDKTNLPDEVILTNYFSVRDDKIVSLVVVFNQPAGY